MRSELVFAARQTVGNRFALCQAAAKGTRKFHRARTRIQDTTNEVLQRLAESDREPVRFDSDNHAAKRPIGSSRGRSSRSDSVNLAGHMDQMVVVTAVEADDPLTPLKVIALSLDSNSCNSW